MDSSVRDNGLVSLYVETSAGYPFQSENVTMADLMRAIKIAEDTEGIFTYTPMKANVSFVQLFDFHDQACKVYLVLEEDECVGEETYLSIENAIGLVKSICAGVTPDRTGWDELT